MSRTTHTGAYIVSCFFLIFTGGNTIIPPYPLSRDAALPALDDTLRVISTVSIAIQIGTRPT
jgi:hypothetical protein